VTTFVVAASAALLLVIGRNTAYADYLHWATYVIWFLALAILVVAALQSTRTRSEGDVVPKPATTSPSTDSKLLGGRSVRIGKPSNLFVGGGALFLAGVYHSLLRPGVIAVSDWVYLGSRQSLARAFPFPTLWAYWTFGRNNIFGVPTYPIWTVMALLARFGASYALSERLVYLVPLITLCYFGTFLLLRKLAVNMLLTVSLSILYTANTFTLDWYNGGWFTILLGYSLLPVVLYCCYKFAMRPTLSVALMTGFLLGIEGWCDVRELILIGIMSLVFLALPLARQRLWTLINRETLKHALWIPVVALALQVHWVLPYLTGATRSLGTSLTSLSQLKEFSLMPIQNTLGLFDLWWPKMHYFETFSSFRIVFVIPFLVLAVALWRTRISYSLPAQFGLGVFLVGSAIATGTDGIFGAINGWLYTNLPAMDLFRYPVYFEQIVILGFVICVGSCFREVSRRAPRPRNSPRAFLTPSTAAGIALAIMFVNVYSAVPALDNSLQKNFLPIAKTNVQTVEQRIAALPPGSVLWLPLIPSLATQNVVTNSDLEHPNVSGSTTVLGSGFNGVAFNSNALYSGNSFSWESNPQLALDLMSQYHISYIVLDTKAKDYSSSSGEPLSTAVIRGTLALGLPRLFKFGQYSVYSLGSHSLVEAFGKVAAVSSTQKNGVLAYQSINLSSGSSVYDADNYSNVSSLSAAKIYGGIKKCDGQNCLALRAAIDGAGVDYLIPLRDRALSDRWTVRIRYRITVGSVLLLQLAGPGIPGPFQYARIYLPSTAGQWAVRSMPFLLSPVGSAPLKVSVILFPPSSLHKGPYAASGEISSIKIAASIQGLFRPDSNLITLASSSGLNESYTFEKHVEMMSRDNTTWRSLAKLTSGSGRKILVFWQDYDPGWVARLQGSPEPLRHVIVDGWANGYLLPTNWSNATLTIAYHGQRYLDIGLLLLWLVVAIVVGTFSYNYFILEKRRKRAEAPEFESTT